MGEPKREVVLARLDTVPGYRRVAEMIEAEIIAGRLSPGELLPVEGELAEQLGVHRSTVREGIRSLEAAGLVRRVGAKRLVVCIPDNQAVAWATTRAMGLQKVSFLDLWEVQMELEPYCAELAARRIDAAAAAALTRNIALLESSLQDDRAIIELDIAFHRLVAEAAGNTALILSREPTSMLLSSATMELYRRVPAARHRLLAAHARICDAILDHDPSEARLWMAKHIRDFRRGYMIAGIDLTAPIGLHPGVQPLRAGAAPGHRTVR